MRSISKSKNLLDVTLSFVWPNIGESISKAIELSFGSYPGVFSAIKALECAFRLLIIESMNKMKVQSDTAKMKSNNEVFESEYDMSPNCFLPGMLKMVNNLRERRLYLSGEEFKELEIENQDDN